MLSGYNIVCFSPNRWDSLWRNRHQIMSRLARQNRVLFVEPAPYLRDKTATPPTASALASPLENLWVYRPPGYAPISGRRPLSDITFSLRKWHLQQTMRRLGMERPLIWVFQYNLGEMLGHLHEQLVIYHAVDEYAAYILDDGSADVAARRQRVHTMEAAVIARSDLVFVTSLALYESKRPLHEHVVLIPNGVDYEHFARPAAHTPPDIATLPRPRIGYAGVINEKLDFALLRQIASLHPAWQFILIGPNALRTPPPDFTALHTLANVHFLGEKTVADLPAYIQACDVCLIPYAKNEWTRNISPLKLYEYLAAGVPIVASDVPDARAFADTLWLAGDAPAFAAAIAEALTASPEWRRQQQDLARQHTWARRIAAMSDAITARLHELAQADQI